MTHLWNRSYHNPTVQDKEMSRIFRYVKDENPHFFTDGEQRSPTWANIRLRSDLLKGIKSLKKNYP